MALHSISARACRDSPRNSMAASVRGTMRGEFPDREKSAGYNPSFCAIVPVTRKAAPHACGGEVVAAAFA